MKMIHEIEISKTKAIPRRNTDDYELLFPQREVELMRHFELFRGEVFVDVGANVGYYTIRAATLYGESILTVAIEAHPETYRALCDNISHNGFKKVIPINKAVHDRKQIVTLYEDRSNDGYLKAGNSTILTSRKSRFKNYRSLDVECDTLDNILQENSIQKADVCKIDIEGAEVYALAGAAKTLKSLRKIIVEIHEYNLESAKSFLCNNDFDVEIVVPYTYPFSDCYLIGTKIS